MNVTMNSSGLNKLLNNLREEKTAFEHEMYEKMTSSYCIGEAEPEAEQINIHEYVRKIREFDNEILQVKHAINKFNCETVIDENTGLTIDQALVLLPIMNAEKALLDQLRQMPDVKRDTNRYLQQVEYTRRNFDKNEADQQYRYAADTIAFLQERIDAANLNIPIHVGNEIENQEVVEGSQDVTPTE